MHSWLRTFHYKQGSRPCLVLPSRTNRSIRADNCRSNDPSIGCHIRQDTKPQSRKLFLLSRVGATVADPFETRDSTYYPPTQIKKMSSNRCQWCKSRNTLKKTIQVTFICGQDRLAESHDPCLVRGVRICYVTSFENRGNTAQQGSRFHIV